MEAEAEAEADVLLSEEQPTPVQSEDADNQDPGEDDSQAASSSNSVQSSHAERYFYRSFAKDFPLIFAQALFDLKKDARLGEPWAAPQGGLVLEQLNVLMGSSPAAVSDITSATFPAMGTVVWEAVSQSKCSTPTARLEGATLRFAASLGDRESAEKITSSLIRAIGTHSRLLLPERLYSTFAHLILHSLLGVLVRMKVHFPVDRCCPFFEQQRFLRWTVFRLRS